MRFRTDDSQHRLVGHSVSLMLGSTRAWCSREGTTMASCSPRAAGLLRSVLLAAVRRWRTVTMA
eukprot:11194669-Lingulodinium_polyedra.AAC.1